MNKTAVTDTIDGRQAVTLAQVEDAFYTLMAAVADKSDGQTLWALDSAREDVLAILAGRPLKGDQPPAGQAAVEEPPDGAAVCSTCHQTLADIARSRFACPDCYQAFDPQAVDAAVSPF